MVAYQSYQWPFNDQHMTTFTSTRKCLLHDKQDSTYMCCCNSQFLYQCTNTSSCTYPYRKTYVYVHLNQNHYHLGLWVTPDLYQGFGLSCRVGRTWISSGFSAAVGSSPNMFCFFWTISRIRRCGIKPFMWFGFNFDAGGFVFSRVSQQTKHFVASLWAPNSDPIPNLVRNLLMTLVHACSFLRFIHDIQSWLMACLMAERQRLVDQAATRAIEELDGCSAADVECWDHWMICFPNETC